jgi:hypothetical protein
MPKQEKTGHEKRWPVPHDDSHPRKLTDPELEFVPRSSDTCSNAEVAAAVAAVDVDAVDPDVVEPVAADPVMALFSA